MKKKYTVFLVLIVLFVSCKKNNPPLPPQSPEGKYVHGLLALNEGLFQQNNSSISFYSFFDQKTYTQSFFVENQRGLGDTANDFEKYTLNGKTYIIIVVDVSSQLEIVDAKTLKSIAQIPIFNGSTAREPRRVLVYQTKAFVCNFDGTVSVVDLTNNTLIDNITVGANPDGLAAIGNKLYVANSGGLHFPVYDSTITVINMDNHTVETTFKTRINSSKMIVDTQNNIYLLSAGNYGSIAPALLRINTTDNTVAEIFNYPITAMTKVNDWIYFYNSSEKSIFRLHTITEEIDSAPVINCSGYETFFGLQYEPELNRIFCFDAKGYVSSSTIHCYLPSGEWQYDFKAELNAKKIIYNSQ